MYTQAITTRTQPTTLPRNSTGRCSLPPPTHHAIVPRSVTSLTHALIFSLIHSLTHSLIHWLTHLLTDSLTHLLTHSRLHVRSRHGMTEPSQTGVNLIVGVRVCVCVCVYVCVCVCVHINILFIYVPTNSLSSLTHLLIHSHTTHTSLTHPLTHSQYGYTCGLLPTADPLGLPQPTGTVGDGLAQYELSTSSVLTQY